MNKTRLEAFSDGVIAILITIMVLELKVPHGHELQSLAALIPTFLSYVLSFLYLGIYWNNHHHLFHACKKVTGGIMWANLHLLFWLSLIPFSTAWMGENHYDTVPVGLYGVNLLLCAISYWLLQQSIVRSQGEHSVLKHAIGKDIKGKLSPFLYLTAIASTFAATWIAGAIYLLVALIWVIPDRRMERIAGISG